MNETLKGNATGAILPPGTLKTVDIGQQSSVTVTIDEVQTEQTFGDPVKTAPLDTPIVRIIYPDGFIKHHEAADIASLMGKVQNLLRGRFGITGFDIASTPASLEPGEIILENVTYAA